MSKSIWLVLCAAFFLAPIGARAQDAPPIPNGIRCDVNTGYTTILGCEQENADLVQSYLANLNINYSKCYNVGPVDTLYRAWLDNTQVNTGSGARYSYQVGLSVQGTDSSSVTFEPPCNYHLPEVLNPWSARWYQGAGNENYILETSTLSCPPHTTTVPGAVFSCQCPNQTAWDGSPWPDLPVPGFPEECGVPPITQGAGFVTFNNVSCPGGNCYEDHRAVINITNGNTTVGVGYGAGITGVKSAYVTRGCCIKVPVTWYFIHRTFHPATGFQGLVPVGPGGMIQLHVAFTSSAATTSYTAQAR
jgi:hypothetical protein